MERIEISVNGGDSAQLNALPLSKEGAWLVPLESFSGLIDAKVEYPTGADTAVVCRADRCAPLKLGDGLNGAVDVDGIVYASPTAIAEPFGFQIRAESPTHIALIEDSGEAANAERAAGLLAPDFVLPELDGKPRRLSDFRGKKTLLYLWASW